MFSRVNLICTLVNTVWGVIGGVILWGYIADPLMEEHVTEGVLKTEIDYAIMTLGFVFVGWGFASIYRKFARTDYGPISGFQLGLLAAVMLGVGKKFIDLATANLMNLEGTLINSFVYLIFFGIMGVLTGLVYKRYS